MVLPSAWATSGTYTWTAQRRPVPGWNVHTYMLTELATRVVAYRTVPSQPSPVHPPPAVCQPGKLVESMRSTPVAAPVGQPGPATKPADAATGWSSGEDVPATTGRGWWPRK